ncbi:MAG TPA: hypothetical protein PLE67_04510 [Tenuifilaceae bacterium]|nr:hypothetical protein [Tenuifilaceae bacterium]
MSMLKRIHIILFTMLVLLIAPLNSCNDFLDRVLVDCSYCYADKPEYGDVELRVTINDENPSVPVTVYYGAFEDNVVAATDTARTEYFYFSLPTDEEYSFRATYQKNGLDYFVINGTKLRTRIDYESCDQPCYFITGDEVDLRKKF